MSSNLFAAVEVEEVCIDGITRYVYKTPLKLQLINIDRHSFFVAELTDELIADSSNESDPVILELGKDIFEISENSEITSEQSTLEDSSSEPDNRIYGISIGENKADFQFSEPDWDIDSNDDTESLFGASLIHDDIIDISSDVEHI
ncbi:hypothetical protein AYI69_g7831 [Smittium culicis]|uniref:Uncharacterized protein n=1 Tax=Smittium culicis TaxID=133412 RepID=A0A1R1XPB2_9FUNG|nr:hypothetical protein AYI69_g7831 [Smittium culicis]